MTGTLVDVVLVSYDSADVLRDAVAPLCEDERLRVIVADNNPGDGSADSVSDPVSARSRPSLASTPSTTAALATMARSALPDTRVHALEEFRSLDGVTAWLTQP